MMWYVYPIVIIMILIAFRKQIFSFISEWYYRYSEKKKHDALMYRLHKHDDAQFSQKDYLKRLNQQKKTQMKKNREKQEDLK